MKYKLPNNHQKHMVSMFSRQSFYSPSNSGSCKNENKNSLVYVSSKMNRVSDNKHVPSTR